MKKLILGTAEFSPKAYGDGVTDPVSLNEVRMILNKAKQGGINILEGAEDYHCDEVLQDLRFELIYKVRHPYSLNTILERTQRTSLMGLMYHHWPEQKAFWPAKDPRVMYTGVSVYTHGQVHSHSDMVEVPLNLEDRRFEKLDATCKLARSVFGRGKLLKQYSVKDCLDYVKSLQNVHGVVIGVNSVKELDEVLKAWHA